MLVVFKQSRLIDAILFFLFCSFSLISDFSNSPLFYLIAHIGNSDNTSCNFYDYNSR